MRCWGYSRRGTPCQGHGYYEVNQIYPSLGAAYGVVVCRHHLAETIDTAWAELAHAIETGLITADAGEAVRVRRTPDAPRLKPLSERVTQLGASP